MATWYHTVLGRYNISDKWIGLDYGKLLMTESRVAESVFAHEMAHNLMSTQTDFGQATYAISKLLEEFKHLNEKQKLEVVTLITKSQEFVQEGIATIFQIGRLRNLTSKSFALNWTNKTLPPEYLDKMNKMLFVFDWSQRYKDYFTEKVSYLVLETGARKVIPQQDLLRTPEKLANYLADENNNPDLRLERLIGTLKYKAWLITKPIPEIAKECGVTFFEPCTKKECADYLTYIASFTNNPHIYSEADIGDSPQGADAFIQAAQNMVVGNMNLDLTNTAEVLFKLEDFLFYADKIEVAFVNPNSETKHRDFIK